MSNNNNNQGWRMFPIAGKLPLVKRWPDVASNDPAVLDGWECQYPGCSWGIATGAQSGIVVLDIDSGGEASLTALEAKHGALPETYTVRTGGGGRHLYFQHPGGYVKNSQSAIGAGLDIRGDRGYVVAAGSLHKSGRKYAVLNDCLLAALPGWLLAKLKRDAPASVQNTRTRTSRQHKSDIDWTGTADEVQAQIYAEMGI